jgi:hypothetical protein
LDGCVGWICGVGVNRTTLYSDWVLARTTPYFYHTK